MVDDALRSLWTFGEAADWRILINDLTIHILGLPNRLFYRIIWRDDRLCRLSAGGSIGWKTNWH
jgi:hypothetical protein